MTSNRDAFSPGRLSFGWVAVWVLVVGFVIWDAIARSRPVLEISARYGVAVDAPAIDPASPTGYAGGRRSILLPAADTAHWVMQTQTMIARGEWRIRHVDYDNAPDGREVHWAAPFHWWLAGLAWIDHLWSGRPLGIAVERATLTAGPVMLVLLLIGLAPLLAWKFSPAAAGLTTLGIVAVFPFYDDFAAACADHHGLVNICCLLTVLLFAAGSVAPTTWSARRWLAGSALAGGVGLWISAATEVPALIGLGLGVLAAGWLARKASRPLTWLADPGLLRFWGLTGGGVSLAAYLIEYFPSHLGLRLEVNHPLYAVAWVGGGEALRVLILAFRNGTRSLSRRDRVGGVVAAGLVALLPAVMAVSRAETFTVADPFVYRLHALYISEFKGLVRCLAEQGLTWNGIELCLPMLLLAPALWLAGRRATTPEDRAQIGLVLLPALLGWVLGWWQIRWLSLAFALTVPVLAVSFRIFAAPGGATRRTIALWTFAGVLVLLPGLVASGQRMLAAGEITAEQVHSLAERDVAHWLRLRGGGDPLVVAAAPSPTTRLIFLGGITGLDTLYWENAAGLKHASALFAAHSPAEARDLARRLGVTHLVYFSWDAFELVQAKLYRGIPETTRSPADLFFANLLSASVPPPWLRAIPYRLPDNPDLANEQVRIWEVVPEQTPAETVAHAADFYLELDRPELAARFAPALAGYPDDLVATVMLAAITSRLSDSTGFAALSARILALLPRAPALSLEDRIHLVVVLVVGQQVELAREQLRVAVGQADERSVRHLTTGTLSDLLTLGAALDVAWPDPALQRLARSLLPPGKRP